MTRLAIIGLDSSHADQFVRLVNVEHRFDDARIVALVDDDAERAEALAAIGDIRRISTQLTQVIDDVDAAIVAHRAGSLHRTPSEVLLTAGIPVFVDKPLAASVADARAMRAKASAVNPQLTSWSAMRFAPDLAKLIDSTPITSRVRTISVTGPADPNRPTTDWPTTESTTRRLRSLCARPSVSNPHTSATRPPTVVTADHAITATWSWSGTDVALSFLRSDGSGVLPSPQP